MGTDADQSQRNISTKGLKNELLLKKNYDQYIGRPRKNTECNKNEIASVI